MKKCVTVIFESSKDLLKISSFRDRDAGNNIEQKIRLVDTKGGVVIYLFIYSML